MNARNDGAPDKAVYLECLLLIERLHRRFLDVLKAELDRLGSRRLHRPTRPGWRSNPYR